VRRGIEFSSREFSSERRFVAGARLSLTDGPLLLASIHVGPADFRKHLLALQNWISDRLLATGRCVFGGDLNSARKLAPWHERYLAGLAALGFVDCHWSLHGCERQTFWGHQAKADYQDDHLFTSLDQKPRVRACNVVDNPKTRELSDHGPLLLELGGGRLTSRCRCNE
jgi:endonuclease/exonuclease/phosphatase family metal-dependent hydrolase